MNNSLLSHSLLLVSKSVQTNSFTLKVKNNTEMRAVDYKDTHSTPQRVRERERR